MDATQKGDNPMASIIILIAGSVLVFLALAKLDKNYANSKRLRDLKEYLRKYPPH